MKRAGGLMETIAEARTLTLAAWRAARGKRDRPEVRKFLERLDDETGKISRELRQGAFRFGHYRNFGIRDPKSRTIHAPPFRDRVVHHALIAVTGPVFESGALAQSYACRRGKGQHAALRQAQTWVRSAGWFFKADLAKYYDSVDHELLRLSLRRRFREQRLLDLFDCLLESYAHSPGKGLPIGALTSQYLGNFYLDTVDRWIKQKCLVRGYLRYMDDLLLFGSQTELDQVRRDLGTVLEGLGLALKHGGILNRCEMGVPYLGFVLYPNRTRLNRLGRRRLRRKLRSLERDWERGRVGERELQARGEALLAHARFGDDVAWRRTVVGFSRFRETPEPATRAAGRLVEQFREELPLGLSQQEQAG
jgi:RNA-directed DNA polymerase